MCSSNVVGLAFFPPFERGPLFALYPLPFSLVGSPLQGFAHALPAFCFSEALLKTRAL
jgi:hypothetical protein